MIVFAKNITPRLRYISGFIGREIFGKDCIITNNRDEFLEYTGAKINYCDEKISEEEYRIENTELLSERSITPQKIECFEVNGYKAFFKTTGDFPFDIFAASFYLLSRYEEYLPHEKDMYGRYHHESSLAFKENFLHLPLVNIWLQDFKKSLRNRFPNLSFQNSQFRFTPTYDIDEAWSYKHKSIFRTMGGTLRSMVNVQWPMVAERIKVLNGKKKDPFDSYDWMDELHKKYNLSPYYFFLIAAKKGKYDKNILPSEEALQNLIIRYSSKYPTGIHPSWQSGDDSQLLKNEILKLGHITGKPIILSRQHFIRFTLPATYRLLIENDITSDFSMGYGIVNGFRASVASEFYWYDLEKEKRTDLLLFPFCFMEANSFFEQKISPQQALNEMLEYYRIIKSVNGLMITIWHNTFLGTAKLFEGWREVYERFIEIVCSDKLIG